MAMKLSEAVPFGRSLQEYVAMFSLSLPDLEGRILSVADGPASFNAELTSSGGKVVSLDPIYQLSSKAILNKFYEVLEPIIQLTIGSGNFMLLQRIYENVGSRWQKLFIAITREIQNVIDI
jgi:hypothetical protein